MTDVNTSVPDAVSTTTATVELKPATLPVASAVTITSTKDELGNVVQTTSEELPAGVDKPISDDTVADKESPEEASEDTPKDKLEEESNGALQLGLSDVEKTELADDGYYKPTGNATVDYVVDTLKGAKVSPEDASALFADVIASQDASKLDMEKLTAAVGADKAELIKLKIINLHRQEQEFVANIDSDIQKYTNGQWDKVSAWAKDNMSPEDKDAYNEMIMVGGKNRELAVRDLTNKYLTANAQPTPPKTGLRGDGQVKSPMMTRDVYSKELAKYRDPYTGKITNTAAVAQLDAKRSQAIAAGY